MGIEWILKTRTGADVVGASGKNSIKTLVLESKTRL